MEEYDVESEVTRSIMQIKTNFENGEVLTFETFEILLALYVSQLKVTKILERQLDYALDTGGSYLEIKDVVS
jgi:hypothetical protein